MADISKITVGSTTYDIKDETARSDFENHKHTKSEITDFPSTMTPSAHNHSASDINSGTLSVARGGTGKASWTANRLIYPSASTTMNQLAFPSTDGSFLRQDKSGAPYWTKPEDLASIIGGGGGKSTTYNTTLFATNWMADGDTSTYVLDLGGITTTSNQEVLPSVNITAQELAALQAANIQDAGQDAGMAILRAFGTMPTINIPIRVIVRGDA